MSASVRKDNRESRKRNLRKVVGEILINVLLISLSREVQLIRTKPILIRLKLALN